ncbi:hypothetical protein [Burkholderia sp. BE17]|uniref:hypothetical protein n=1 Tax=Burkholderia sp. BE17 TaxID=2656644 RepID=UPI00128CF8A5|nr:hypothetical protein [Burkholderia sp. BE17]MPV71618.1 hypothetical protein [Burkholderia sp. BE17]
MSTDLAKRPLLRIVGGLMEASNSKSTAPFVTISSWGVQTPLHHHIGGVYCYTKAYGSSYGRLSIYLSQDESLDMVVGGKMWANNDSSSNTPVEEFSWGYTGPDASVIKSAFSGYGWSSTYKHGYVSCDLYMLTNPSGAGPIGGRYYSTNNTSTATKVTETFWGLSDGNEVGLFNGYNYSAAYKEGYGYATIVLPK